MDQTGYAGVYSAKSKVRPFMAQIKNERTGKVQSIGSFETAQQAAVAYTRAMMDGEGQDMDSPPNRQPKGTACHSAPPPPLPCMPSCLCQHAYVWPGRPTGSLQPSRSVTGTLHFCSRSDS